MKFVKQHILPLLLAGIASFIFIQSGIFTPYSKVVKQPNDLQAQTYFPYYANDLTTELWLRTHLKNKSIVILGSSELTAQTRKYIPNKFLMDSLGIPCIAFGKGGNQCFSIFTQLLSFHKNLEGSRIVIVLSPGWFDEYSEGTSAEMFLLYNNKRTLNYVLEDDSIPSRFRNYTGKYIVHHMPAISSPDETLIKLYYEGLQDNPIKATATSPFSCFHSACLRKRNSILENGYKNNFWPYPMSFAETENLLPGINTGDNHHPVKINWDSLYKNALTDFNKISNNNSSGVENDYYNTWVRGKAPKKIKGLSLEENQEYQDFLQLMDLLSYYKVDAYFMIQGLNPYAFDDLHKLDPTIEALKTEIDKHHFEYFNMFTSDKSKYVKGTLNDIMHTGEYGWLKADSAIVGHYFKKS